MTTPKQFNVCFGMLALFSMTSVVLIAAVLGLMVRHLNSTNTKDVIDDQETASLVNQIKIDDLVRHLKQLQIIANQSNGIRAIGTQGFNDTLRYITEQLEQYTSFTVRHEYFTVKNTVVQGTAQLLSKINDTIQEYVYLQDFTHILFSPGLNLDSFTQLTLIPNLGCQDSDWSSVSVRDSVALVKRGDCTFPEKTLFAENYGARAMLIYNDGIDSSRFRAYRNVRGHANMKIPGYFLSYELGTKFANARSNISISMKIDVRDAEGVGNICADTPTGSQTQTIIVGSHSDGVLDGSGINDNGSGTVGNLALALALARLLKTSSLNYVPYSYRIRFCWWGAEELGLLGSTYHVQQATLPTATTESGRLQDYLLYFNYDMLASPNNNFGILDSISVPSGTPAYALHGTDKITNLFQQWFNQQKLPWSRSGIGGGSDFVPFLRGGVVSGGVNTGAGGIKSASERDRYAELLGTGNGGIANIAFDPCYHQSCDQINNINPFAYEKVVKAAAYALEFTGRLNDLEKWLYPEGRQKNIDLSTINKFPDIYYEPELF